MKPHRLPFLFSLALIVPLLIPQGTFAAAAHPVSIDLKVKSSSISVITGYSPGQIKTAYGIQGLSQNGAGQTIGIIDAYDAPTIQQDLATFSNHFKLPGLNTNCIISSAGTPCLEKVYGNGVKPAANASWAQEASLDVEWAHAIAPQANILLVEASTDSTEALMQAVDVATKKGASVISMSWGGPEFSTEKDLDSHFRHTTSTYIASAGDDGNAANYPAASPYVLSVGGTTLKLNPAGSIAQETAWSGSGGGISTYEVRPTYQKKVSTITKRTIPDVSYDADPETGFSVYDSTNYGGNVGWLNVGGTSAGAPQWAGIIALANQGKSKPLHSNLSTEPLYQQASKTPTIFRDIFSGSNGSCGLLCTASTGFDALTGLGSPKANLLIPALQ